MSAKIANYTEEQTVALVNAYSAAETESARADVVTTFAKTLGKSVASIRAKLSREGVYVKKVATRKDGTAVVKKDELAMAAGKLFGLTEAEEDSLTKANRSALVKILNTVARMNAALVIADDLTEDEAE